MADDKPNFKEAATHIEKMATDRLGETKTDNVFERGEQEKLRSFMAGKDLIRSRKYVDDTKTAAGKLSAAPLGETHAQNLAKSLNGALHSARIEGRDAGLIPKMTEMRDEMATAAPQGPTLQVYGMAEALKEFTTQDGEKSMIDNVAKNNKDVDPKAIRTALTKLSTFAKGASNAASAQGAAWYSEKNIADMNKRIDEAATATRSMGAYQNALLKVREEFNDQAKEVKEKFKQDPEKDAKKGALNAPAGLSDEQLAEAVKAAKPQEGYVSKAQPNTPAKQLDPNSSISLG